MNTPHGNVVTKADEPPADRIGRSINAVRGNSFGAIVMLLTQYALGIWVNLFGQLPASDHGKGTFPAFGSAVANGPVVLALHAVLGTLLVAAAIAALVRSFMTRRRAWIAVTAIALAAIVAAWVSGSSFVGAPSNSASFSMAMATAVAILSYVIILLTSGWVVTGHAQQEPSPR
jgi:hypothetical protein